MTSSNIQRVNIERDETYKKRWRGCCSCFLRFWKFLQRLFRRKKKAASPDTAVDDAAQVPYEGNGTAVIQEYQEYSAPSVDSWGSSSENGASVDEAKVPIKGKCAAEIHPAPSVEESLGGDNEGDLRGHNVAYRMKFDKESAAALKVDAIFLTVADVIIFSLLYLALLSPFFMPVEIAPME